MSKLQLTILSQQMADLTQPECAKCRVPHRCCDAMYCQEAVRYAKEDWGVELVPTGHPTLPMMGPTGCTVPPHLRPICTVHTCKIASVGTSGNRDWDAKYFALREMIEELL